MATRGRNICNTLKAIRKQIADANGISYSPEECHFKGECKGTCPKCEQDVRDLEYELHLRQMAGKAIKVAGIAAGLVAMTACSDGKVQRISSDATKSELNIVKEEVPKPGDGQLEGDISIKYDKDEKELKERIEKSKKILKNVKCSDEMYEIAAKISIALNVDGHRADISVIKTAITIAAYEGRENVSKEDMLRAAVLALPHRMRKTPFEDGVLEESKLEKLIESL